MAFFSDVFDVQLTIFRRVGDGPAIGTKSKYDTEAFPSTGKTIDGFAFDEKRWGGVLDDNLAHFAPVLWDPSTIGLSDSYKTGIGDNNDLYVTTVKSVEHDGTTTWRPNLQHGFYYAEGEEFYYHSDDGVIDYVTLSGLAPSGGNSLLLSFDPKPGIPIMARSYEWDDTLGVYLPDKTVRKRVAFTGQFTTSGELLAQDGNVVFWQNVNTAEEEWFLDDTTTPPTAVFNQQIVEAVGQLHTTTSGLDQAELDQLDSFGISDGTDAQSFHLTYSPVDRSSEIRVYSDFLGVDNRSYTVVENFTASGIDEVKIDYDLGVAEFGTVASGGVPPYGSTMRAAYFKTVGLEYEPENSRDFIQNVDADLNPIRRFAGDGFVFLRNKALDVSKLELEAILPEISEDFFGPLFIGNSFATIQATALTDEDEIVEGQEITFEILDVGIGSFGASDTTEALTNAAGQARTLYNPPRAIEQLGGVTDTVVSTASGTSMYLDGYVPASTTDPLFLFQVAREDLILGIPKADLRTYYEDFLTEEGIDGPSIDFSLDLTENYAWLGSAVEEQIKWEVWHRTVHDLATPLVYEPEDLRTGKKSVISQLSISGVNPHTGTTPAIVPVQPTSFSIVDSGTNIEFDTVLPDITTSSLAKSYLVIGPTKVRLRAKTTNARTGAVVTSNTIEILIDIPDASKGLLDIDLINSVPSGLLTNAHYFDQENIPLEHVELTQSGLLPVGWRLRSPTITLASALDSVTFLDLNPIPQSYTYSGVTTASGLLVDLGHQFEVVI